MEELKTEDAIIKCPVCGSVNFMNFEPQPNADARFRTTFNVICGNLHKGIYIITRAGNQVFTSFQMYKTPEEQKFDYKAYLLSPEWKAKSEHEKIRAGYHCELCYEHEGQLNTHHKTYAHIGNEQPGELIVLCKNAMLSTTGS